MGFSIWKRTAWMDELANTSIWFGLLNVDPANVIDPLTVELQSNSYVRPQVIWSRPEPLLLRNSAAMAWNTLPAAAVVAAICGFDAAVNGNLVFSSVLASPHTVDPSGTFVLPAMSYYVGLPD